MPLKVKSNDVEKQLAFVSDIGVLTDQWERDNADGSIPISYIAARRTRSGIAQIHCASPATKALNQGQEYWLGSMPAVFKPMWNMYGIQIELGTLTLKYDGGKAVIMFKPSRNITTSDTINIDVAYLTAI